MSLYPLTFTPRFKERVWGGRRLAEIYGKAFAPDLVIGESWEISDRPGDESVIANGSLAGRTLRWLMEQHAGDMLGSARPAAEGRFPLLCKILDARDKLSLQVHPPADKADALGGEPKTEMWYIAAADPGAELFVGLRPGVSKAQFEAKLDSGEVAECFHRIPVRTGDTMFLPSGRVHAIGAGLVIFEIQQNSDTTYRVFDWNRLGLDGRPRELHIPQSMASIDFDDFAPVLAEPPWESHGALSSRALVRHALFTVSHVRTRTSASLALNPPRLRVIAVVDGGVDVRAGGTSLALHAGQFALVPAVLRDVSLAFDAGAGVLVVEAG